MNYGIFYLYINCASVYLQPNTLNYSKYGDITVNVFWKSLTVHQINIVMPRRWKALLITALCGIYLNVNNTQTANPHSKCRTVKIFYTGPSTENTALANVSKILTFPEITTPDINTTTKAHSFLIHFIEVTIDRSRVTERTVLIYIANIGV